jgi:hypothetical protein
MKNINLTGKQQTRWLAEPVFRDISGGFPTDVTS